MKESLHNFIQFCGSDPGWQRRNFSTVEFFPFLVINVPNPRSLNPKTNETVSASLINKNIYMTSFDIERMPDVQLMVILRRRLFESDVLP